MRAEDFKRLSGVHFETVNQMGELGKLAESWRHQTGRQPKLRIADQIFMALEYWREDRTYFHLGSTWGVNESTAERIIQKIENILIQAPELRLPGKKRLIQDDCQLETVLIDVSETPRERHKKTKKHPRAVSKKDIR